MSENKLGDVSFFIDHDNHILYAERRDVISKEGIYAEWNAMQQLEGFDASYETIIDYSNVPRVDLNAADLIELNREMPKHDVRTNNVAIVAGLIEGRHMLARLFCAMTNLIGSRKHQVFHTKSEAELWILSLRKNK